MEEIIEAQRNNELNTFGRWSKFLFSDRKDHDRLCVYHYSMGGFHIYKMGIFYKELYEIADRVAQIIAKKSKRIKKQ